MDKKNNLYNINKKIEEYKKATHAKENPRFYFDIFQTAYSKKKLKNYIKYNDMTYFKTEKRTLVITKSINNLSNYIKNKYKRIPIKENEPFCLEKNLTLKIIKKEINFNTILTIKDYLQTEQKAELKKITECLKKQLKLKDTDKISIISSTGEGQNAGDVEETSGDAITSTNTYTHFWLRYDNKKGYYLDYIKPIKIIDLDKKK